jgi:eukaryotic-like serine/threonine-protein kinase
MSDLPNGRAPGVDDVTHAQPSTRAVDSIGPYRLLQRVGEGGMGEVWLAEQTRPVRRQVALKIIKAGMDTAQVVARFEAERQALAVMDHPAIARVFDAGATPQGRPYFVMEYVRGESITAYCNKHKLPIRDRLDLFLQVCDGVQHAHQKGVIHRDLKPSNILVTVQDDHPVPKIIDFGVAKATTQHLTDRTLYTELGVLIGTPEYMSPEQAEMTGLDIDTRADVYSLGVILYELLTDVLPFDARALRQKGLDDLRRMIREIDPPRPSTRVTTIAAATHTPADSRPVLTQLARQLRGDLDWITMRALEKDRTHRYGSATELAADLRRHLDDLPVLASPPGTAYRVNKFVRRHRGSVTAAATLVVLLLAFAATMAIQAQRIGRERDRANGEAETARQVSNFVVGLFKVSDPSEARGNQLTAREILDKGATDIDKTLTTQPEIQARLQQTIGTVYTNLGLYSAAEPLLQRALTTDRRVLGDNSPQTLAAISALADVNWYLGRYAYAEPLYLELVERRRRIFGEEHRDTLRASFDLASLYVLQKRWDEAEQLMRKTFDTQRRVLGEEHPDTLGSMNNLGSFYWRRNRYADAQAVFISLVQVSRRVLGNDDPQTLEFVHNLGTNLVGLGRDAEAEPLFLEALQGKRRVLGENHFRTLEDKDQLAIMYRKQRRFAEAEPLALGAYQGAVATYGSQHESVKDKITELVALYDAWGKTNEATDWRTKLPKPPSAAEAAR